MHVLDDRQGQGGVRCACHLQGMSPYFMFASLSPPSESAQSGLFLSEAVNVSCRWTIVFSLRLKIVTESSAFMFLAKLLSLLLFLPERSSRSISFSFHE